MRRAQRERRVVPEPLQVARDALTVGEALAAARERLGSVSESPRLDAQRLLELILERDVAWLFAHADAPLEAAAAARLEAALARRARGEPLAYIAGSSGFYGRSFVVSPAVLVPRPESEHIVALALAHLGTAVPDARPRICDVGTGSGNLAVTLALEVAGSSVVALDISPAALAVAAHNARVLGAADRIRFVQSDLFDSLAAGERFDCIVANLPYVRTGELAPRPAATAFEPRTALDGGADGLQLYRRLLAAPQRLSERGLLLMEAGPDTAPALAALARETFGARATIALSVDYARRERVVGVRLPGSLT